MQRLDGQYLYTLGHQIHGLAGIRNGASYGEILGVVWVAETALEPFLNSSIYQLRHSLQSAHVLLSWVKHISLKAFGSTDLQNDRIEEGDLTNLKNALAVFEINLAPEFALMDTYLVAPKGGYNTSDLIENGGALFQPTLAAKVPVAIRDLRQATRCIAFELPTAAGFHLHRANEAVLHSYFDAVRGDIDHPKENNRNMGIYIKLLDENVLGDKRVRVALRDLKDLHRNPLIHPDHDLDTVEEAIDLLGAIRATIGSMLPSIPVVPTVPQPPVGIIIPAPPTV